MNKLQDKHFFITGASSGIGLSTVELFIQEGAVVTGLGRDAKRLQSALAAKGIPEQRTLAVQGDITSEKDLNQAVQAGIKHFGRLDGLIHSAGYDFHAPLEQTALADWHKIMESNLTSAFLLSKAVMQPLQAAGGGSIVFVSSAAGLKPLGNRVAYSSSKAGLVAFGKALAMELAPSNVRVNVICPGVIDTPMLQVSWQNAPNPQQALAEIKSRNVMQRVATPEEVATSILYLACNDASFVTGIALAVDGGRTFH